MWHASAAAFGEALEAFNHASALYSVITVLSAVGFGDITPRGDPARIVVSLQVLFDLVLLGAVVRLVAGAARFGMSRGSSSSEEA